MKTSDGIRGKDCMIRTIHQANAQFRQQQHQAKSQLHTAAKAGSDLSGFRE